MNKRSIAIVSLLLFVTLSCFSQARDSVDHNAQFEAGMLLKKFSRQYFIGVGVSTAGYLITLAALNNDDASKANDLATIGGIAVLAGTIVMISSHSKVGQAGEKLMISSQALGLNNQRLNSIGWAFRIGKRNKQREKLLVGR